MQGKIKWFSAFKGYGFIEVENKKDVFLHDTNIPEGTHLKEGDAVEFEVEKDEKGTSAIRLRKL